MKYVCQICGFVYDEAQEKVPFSELPDSWKCPLCRAAKSDFAPEKSESTSETARALAVPMEADIKKLSVGQLAALCSNLARGCEKQYKAKEAEPFKELSDYFTIVAPEIKDASVEKLAKALKSDTDSYADLRATADANSDRGAARVCVWGEKVTRMLSSLVSRYLIEGEKMLADTDIWVCTTCGFVFIGKNPPELCPVCKVPAWKFEKIEGRA